MYKAGIYISALFGGMLTYCIGITMVKQNVVCQIDIPHFRKQSSNAKYLPVVTKKTMGPKMSSKKVSSWVFFKCKYSGKK